MYDSENALYQCVKKQEKRRDSTFKLTYKEVGCESFKITNYDGYGIEQT